jgi:hypothetical protein
MIIITITILITITKIRTITITITLTIIITVTITIIITITPTLTLTLTLTLTIAASTAPGSCGPGTMPKKTCSNRLCVFVGAFQILRTEVFINILFVWFIPLIKMTKQVVSRVNNFLVWYCSSST